MQILFGTLLILILGVMIYLASSAHFANKRHKKTRYIKPACGQVWIENGSTELEIVALDRNGTVHYCIDEGDQTGQYFTETKETWEARVLERQRYLIHPFALLTS